MQENMQPVFIRKTENRDRARNVLCLYRCRFCQSEFETLRFLVNRGSVVSCGCYHRSSLKAEKTVRARTKKSDKDRAIQYKYRRYRDSAKKRGLSFNLSVDEFGRLLLQACKYCGAEPAKEIDISKHMKFIPIETKVSGIDRLNNCVGYEPTNCVTCCETCNRLKHSMGAGDFIEHLLKICQNLRFDQAIESMEEGAQ